MRMMDRCYALLIKKLLLTFQGKNVLECELMNDSAMHVKTRSVTREWGLAGRRNDQEMRM